MATLHIIGNGFDLAHGILLTYKDFEKYAWSHSSHNSYYLEVLENCYPQKNKDGRLIL